MVVEPIADLRRRNKWRWRLLRIWIILVSVAFIFAWFANQNRINDIQQARVHSCEQGYDGLKQAFSPFKPNKKSPQKQKDDWNKFNNNIDSLKKKCAIQTQVKSTK